jgi:hypothetical protein
MGHDTVMSMRLFVSVSFSIGSVVLNFYVSYSISLSLNRLKANVGEVKDTLLDTERYKLLCKHEVS